MAAAPRSIVVIATVKEYRFVHVSAKPEKQSDTILTPHLPGPNPLDEPLPDAMVLEVQEVLKGRSALLKTALLVFGDNGYLCRPYVTMFPVGTRWAFVLHEEDQETCISVCGEFWLKEVKGKYRGVVEGRNPKRIRDLSIEQLRKKIGANQSSEPTPTSVTSAAEQPLVPAAVVAHL
jgi:hypothetical protein